MPFLEDLEKSVENITQQIEPEPVKMIRDFEKASDHPAAKTLISLAQDPVFRKSVADLAHSKLWLNLAGAEVALILIFWIVRAWRITVATVAWKKIWVQFYLASFYWPLAIVGLPFWILGEPIRLILSGLLKSWLQSAPI
jgi:hypothetical protein